MDGILELRAVEPGDFTTFHTFESDADARLMVAFASRDVLDATAFASRWTMMLRDPTVRVRTILLDGAVAGNVMSFEFGGTRNVGYWIAREYWGKGIATWGLGVFLREEPLRPIFARAAKDNHGSLRVLQKCGFWVCGEDISFAGARGVQVEEYVMRLD